MSEKNELAKIEEKGLSAFSSMGSFENAQRMAQALSQSNIVPRAYQGNVPNTLVALEMAHRIGISPVMVMQNLDIIQGKPSWRSSFIISALNSSGRFSPLRFKFEGEKGADDYGCTAYAKDLDNGEIVEGVKVDWAMVKAEGWNNNNGSKWKTMPELMFRYRAASFFGRLFAPDILTGMHTADELMDISRKAPTTEEKHALLKSYYEENDFNISEEDRMHIERVIDEKENLSYDKAYKALQDNIITKTDG